MSEFWVARALRTTEWTYVVAAPRRIGHFSPARNAARYSAFQLYNDMSHPHQLINVAGRKETVVVEEELRERLKNRMNESEMFLLNWAPASSPMHNTFVISRAYRW